MLVLILLAIPVISDTYQTHGVTLANDNSDNTARGFKFVVNVDDAQLENIEFKENVTTCGVYDATGTVIKTSTTWSGNNCSLKYNFSKGTTYQVRGSCPSAPCDDDYAAYTGPYNLAWINITGTCVNGGSDCTEGGNLHKVEGIHLSNASTVINETVYGNAEGLETKTATFTLKLDTDDLNFTTAASLVWNNTAYATTAVNNSDHRNHSATVTIPSIGINENITYYFNFSVNGVAENTTKTNQTIYNIDIDNCTIYSNPTINFSVVRDELSDDPLVVNFTYVWEYNSGETATSYNGTTTDRHNVSFCLSHSSINITGDITMQYAKAGYDTRDYIQNDMRMDNDTNSITLYMLTTGSSSQVTIHTVDEKDQDLSNIIIEAYKWDIDENNYDLVETESTDSNGEAYLDLVVGTTYYKFLFYRDGLLQLETQRFKIFDTTLEYVLADIETTVLEEWMEIQTISANITYSNTTKLLTFIWNDLNSIANNYCFNITTYNQTYYSNCSTSTSGSMTYILTEYNRSYDAEGYAKHSNSGKYYKIANYAVNLYESWMQFIGSANSLALSFILLITMALIAITNKSAIVLFSSIALIAMYWIGLLPIGLMSLMGILFIATIILIVINRRKT